MQKSYLQRVIYYWTICKILSYLFIYRRRSHSGTADSCKCDCCGFDSHSEKWIISVSPLYQGKARRWAPSITDATFKLEWTAETVSSYYIFLVKSKKKNIQNLQLTSLPQSIINNIMAAKWICQNTRLASRVKWIDGWFDLSLPRTKNIPDIKVSSHCISYILSKESSVKTFPIA